MAKFHINPETGNPGECKAVFNCPFAPLEDHYETANEARRAYEKTMESFTPVDMKHLNQDGLKAAILLESQLSEKDLIKLEEAMNLAEKLHQGQVRKALIMGRSNTPYIEHPYRNTLRMIRWGIDDVSMLEATVLHDTVEDCSNKFAEDSGKGKVDEPEARKLLSSHIEKQFSEKTKDIVLGVTNPYLTKKEFFKQTPEEKRDNYARQVRKEISESPEVYLVKLSDFIDNAGSLHHAVDVEVKGSQRLARKYLPLINDFKENLNKHDLPIDDNSKISILEKLDKMDSRLKQLLQREAKD